MKETLIRIFLLLTPLIIYSQKRTFKCEKIHDAVKLIDNGKYNEAISILRECEKIDPKDYVYPYEIALAFSYNKEYDKSVNELQKIKDYENIGADYYQLLGNNFDFLSKPELAIATYNEGLKKFPNAGRLYLEKGVIYEYENKISEAVETYEKGISVDPSYPSNYYRLATIYLITSDKLSGLMYGEIFLNLERTSARSQEMSKMLYDAYKSVIVFESDEIKRIDFCEAIIDTEKYDKTKKLPFCIIFGRNFVLATINYKEFSLNNLSEMRMGFLKQYLQNDYKDYPNVLINYFKKMEENKVFDAYNHYIFQMGAEKEFKEWMTKNEASYQKFVDWYTMDENLLKIDRTNVFISDQLKYVDPKP